MGAQPSRNVRRKTKDVRAGREREDTEGIEARNGSSDDEDDDDDTQPAVPTEQEIIASLKVAERHVNATEDFANDLLEGQENVPGYGKIAGRDWAFIIRKVEVNIGRPEAHEKWPADGEPVASQSTKAAVDIDLGPDRQVSRCHALISYDSEHAKWLIAVNGRNGLRVDNNLLKRGSKCYMRNGSVIEIAGTQMAFITSTGEDSEGPIWDATILRQALRASEEDEEVHGPVLADGHALRSGADISRLPPEYKPQGHSNGSVPARAHPHSSRAAGSAANSFQLQPGTPTRSMANQYMIKSSPNAGFAKGINIESTESIDYSSNAAKDLKPPHSYAQLIGMAILSTSDQQMTLSNIYKWIMANYAFYRFNTGGWQNSIRHNLSLNKAFTKIARRTDEPGKGMKWMIEPSEFESFVGQGMKGCRRPPVQANLSQLPSATQATLPDASSPLAIRNAVRQDGTPPLPQWNARQHSTAASTPDQATFRGRVAGESTGDSTGAAAETLDYLRTTPRNGLSMGGNPAGSPPALFVPDDGRVAAGMDTPFPLKPAQRLAPPSSLKRPSDFIQFSSPAPFWKMEGLVGNTPWKFDLSPLKTPFTGFDKVPKLEADDDRPGLDSKPNSASTDGAFPNGTESGLPEARPVDANIANVKERQASPVIQSSSPPQPSSAGLGAVLANGSPTATRPGSRLAGTTTNGPKGLNLLAAATHEAEREASQPPAQALISSRPTPPSAPQMQADGDMDYDDGEDKGIDLAK